MCVDKSGDDWEASDKKQEQDGDDSDQEQGDNEDDQLFEVDVEPPCPKVKSFKEVIVALEDVSQLLESQGHIHACTMVGSVIDEVAGLKAKSSRQTTIHDFL